MANDQRAQICGAIEEHMPPPPSGRQRFREAVRAAHGDGLEGDAAIRRAGDVVKEDAELWGYFIRLSTATDIVENAITGGSAGDVPRPAWQPSETMTWDQLIAAVAAKVRGRQDPLDLPDDMTDPC